MIWDFDLTLSEEYQQMPLIRHNFEKLKTKHGMQIPEDYFKLWDERRKSGFAAGLNYMGQMLDDFRDGCIDDLSYAALRQSGAEILLSPGMPEYLQRVKDRWAQSGVDVHHFIVTAGIKPIVEGSPVARFADDIYAGTYAERNGKPFEIMSVPQAFQKVEAIIQIAKGDRAKRDIKMPYEEYAYAYRNMLIIGDGFSDIPPMAYARQRGAMCICVYKSTSMDEFRKAKGMTEWAHFLVPRDYREGMPTEKKLDLAISRIVNRTCDFPPKLVHDYYNNRLTNHEVIEFVETHTNKCSECSRYMTLEYVLPNPAGV